MATKPDQKPARWGRRVGIAAAVLLLLVVVIYFVATSAFFLKTVILPKASASLGADIQVQDASISPFSSVMLKGISVKTTGAEPLLAVDEVQLRYGLMDIIGGKIKVDQATVVNPRILIVQEADGSSNLDPLLKKKTGPQEQDSSSSKPLDLQVTDVSLKNASLKMIQKGESGQIRTSSINNLNLAIDRIQNGSSGKVTMQAAIRVESNGAATNDLLVASLDSALNFAIDQQVKPQSLSGALNLAIKESAGGFAQLGNLTATAQVEVTPTEIKEVALRVAKADQQLGSLRVFGPFNATSSEGRVNVHLSSIDRNVLGLAGGMSGMDFRNSRLSSTNTIELTQKGKFIAASGTLTGSELSVQQGAQSPTPPVNLLVDYQVATDLIEKVATIQKLAFNAGLQNKPFLQSRLDNPMNLSWGGTSRGMADSTFVVTITNLNLADWSAMLGTNPPAGVINSGIRLVSKNEGKLLVANLVTSIDSMAFAAGTNRVRDAAVKLEADATVAELKQIDVSRFMLGVTQHGEPLLQANGSARLNQAAAEMAAQLSADVSLPVAARQGLVPGFNARKGSLKFSAKLTDEKGKKNASGSMQVVDLDAEMNAMRFANFQTDLAFNVDMAQDSLTIHRIALALSEGSSKGGTIEINGKFNTASKVGETSFKAVDVNEHAFRPFMASALGENQLVSILLNSSGNAKISGEQNASIKTDLTVKKLVVLDAAKKLPQKPLELELKLDAGKTGDLVELRELALQLTPTERAKNLLTATARLDLAKTNPSPGSFKLGSDSFDVTPYYDLFAGDNTKATNVATRNDAPPSIQPDSKPETEPQPMDLPIKDLVAEIDFKRLYLREIVISNWVARTTIKGGTIKLDPFQLSLNGAPVRMKADFDVSVPGYRYDLSVAADQVPLEPIANTFSTNSRGQFKGLLLANASLNGAGVTGSNIQRNLGGNLGFSVTNMNLQVVGPKIKRVLDPIALALRVPELTQTPLNWINANALIQKGNVDLKEFAIQSEAFFATSQGSIKLEPVLTNSPLNLPITLSLRRSLAEKANLLPQGTPEAAKYAELPKFVTIKGTLGAPETDLNKLALAGIAARGISGIPGVGEKAGNVLEGVGNILSGQGGGTNTNSSPAKLIDGLGGLLGRDKSSATNSTPPASTNSPATNKPARLNPFDLLKSLPQQ
ncbi:MAG: AsmA family protein [Verrucomicrobiota bacterium]|nr:AsmA family protein [Verrucomicrobiota bacterium]